MTQVARFLLAVFAVFIANTTHAQFEGIIEYWQKSVSDSLLCTFTVKEPMVRYEEHFTNGKLKRAIVLNIKTGKGQEVNPMGTVSAIKQYSPNGTGKGSYTVIKKENSKKIDGKDCPQWIVRNESENTMMMFYVYRGEFSFYTPFAQFAHTFSKTFRYFAAAPESENDIPLGVTAAGLLLEKQYTVELKAIKAQKIDDSRLRYAE